jgi:hypothetical protein
MGDTIMGRLTTGLLYISTSISEMIFPSMYKRLENERQIPYLEQDEYELDQELNNLPRVPEYSPETQARSDENYTQENIDIVLQSTPTESPITYDYMDTPEDIDIHLSSTPTESPLIIQPDDYEQYRNVYNSNYSYED